MRPDSLGHLRQTWGPMYAWTLGEQGAGGSRRLFSARLGESGPLLVFLPGLSATTRYWQGRVEPLAQAHRLLVLDLLGFGKSPKPWVTYTVARHVSALHGTLPPHGPLTLVGHSFGAVAAVAFAAAHPDRVERLILIGMPAFAGESQAKAFVRQRRRPDRWLLTNMAIASLTCLLTRRLMRPVLRHLSRDLPPEVVDDLVLHTWRSSTSTLWEGVYRHDVVDDVARLPSDLPMLLLHGDADAAAPLWAIPRVMEAHPRAVLRVLRGVDHHPVLRQPKMVNMEIGEFVQRTARRVGHADRPAIGTQQQNDRVPP